MKEIISEKHLVNFSYENCMSRGHVKDKMYKYLATVNEDFISLRTFECEDALKLNPNPLGWKFHISIDDDHENLIRAWNVIAPILIEKKINFTKFLRPSSRNDESRNPYERGRQFTIYIEQNHEKTTHDWQHLINIITERLVENNIRPGYTNLVAKVVQGSSYFYYRNDKPKLEAIDNPDNAIAASPSITKMSEQARADNPHLELPSPKIENRAELGGSHSHIEPTPAVTKKSDHASDSMLPLVSSPTLYDKSAEVAVEYTQKESSTKKAPIVPMLNLKGAVPIQNWARTKPARAKDIYLDNNIEKKYNPSNSEEGLLLPLRVDFIQPQPKEPPREPLPMK